MREEETIKFDRDRATKYDKEIRKVIPGYEALHDMTNAILGVNLSESANLLVVGSGTGREILNLSQSYPHWEFMGVDPSSEMMAIAQTQFTQQRLLQRVKSYLGYTDTLPEIRVYDAATLMLVMHFVPDDGAKLSLLQSISKRLKPGATLIVADLHGDTNSARFKQLMAAWRGLRLQNLEDMSIEEYEADFQRSMNSIHFIPEARIFKLLQEAGFSEIVKFYNAFLFGGWTAKLANC
jgi:tRNA (cmo5U34)-methyltransferase